MYMYTYIAGMCTLPRVHNEETCLPPGVHICSRDLKVPLHTIAHVCTKLLNCMCMVYTIIPLLICMHVNVGYH